MDLTRHPASLTTRTHTAAVTTDRLRPHPFHQTNSQNTETQTTPNFPGSVRPNTTGTPTTPIGVTETTEDTSNWPVATDHSAFSPPGGMTTSTTTRHHIRSPHSDGDTSKHLTVDSRLHDQYHFSETSTGSQPQYSDAIRLADTTGPDAAGDGCTTRRDHTSDVGDRLQTTTASLPTRYRSPLVDADRLLSPTGYRPASRRRSSPRRSAPQSRRHHAASNRIPGTTRSTGLIHNEGNPSQN